MATETIFRHDPAHARRMADMLKNQAMHVMMEGASKQAEVLQKRAAEWERIAEEAERITDGGGK